MIVQGTRAGTGDVGVEWARLVGDLERFGLLGGPGACDAVARVGADVLHRADADATTTDAVDPAGEQQGQVRAP